MKKCLLSIIVLAALFLAGCSSSSSYTQEDLDASYSKGYRQGVYDASTEVGWRIEAATQMLNDIANEQAIAGLGPIYGRLYESDSSLSLSVTETALEGISKNAREIIKLLNEIVKEVNGLKQ